MAILDHVAVSGGLQKAQFLDIEDIESEFTAECQEKRSLNRVRFLQKVGERGSVTDFGLLETSIQIKRFVQAIVADGAHNVIVDISSLPKRFFFLIIRELLKSKQIGNLVATYSIPEKHFQEEFATEPQDWAVLPGFQREDVSDTQKCAHVIVGVGFLPFRLPDLLKHGYHDANVEVTLILPFPPGPPQFQRNWKFVHEIEKTCPLKSDRQIVRVDAHDVSRCFDYFSSITRDGADYAVFAPFGPKPHSLAMCLFAIKHDCDAYYTQPKHYHPDYSTGIKKMLNGMPETYAYLLRAGDINFY